uniref:Uncharacterized protein n=1 Tax=Anopheles melas TaxID=34690 RepID=A0A182U763_9DIPT
MIAIVANRGGSIWPHQHFALIHTAAGTPPAANIRRLPAYRHADVPFSHHRPGTINTTPNINELGELPSSCTGHDHERSVRLHTFPSARYGGGITEGRRHARHKTPLPSDDDLDAWSTSGTDRVTFRQLTNLANLKPAAPISACPGAGATPAAKVRCAMVKHSDYTDGLDVGPRSSITIIDSIIIIIVVVDSGFALVGTMAVIAIRGIKQLPLLLLP